jgi:hypothetical protein
MKSLLSKCLTLYILLKNPKVPSQYRFFLRFFYLGKLVQLKYLFKDYILKKRYKVVDYNGEFAPELKFVLPYAYWHYKNGTLQKTVSNKFTKEFYFFSEEHHEAYSERHWNDFHYDLELPNSEDHNFRYDFSKWEQVPLKSHFKNDIFIFEKPTLIIANRYNTEWNSEPVSYFSIDTLDKILSKAYLTYQVIYNRPSADKIVNDNSKVLNLDEEIWLKKKYPNILLMNELYEKHKDIVRNFNHLQLMVYANSERFVSIHGGTAVLASYFEGVNIIFSKKGFEHYFGEFKTIFTKLSGAKIIHAPDEAALYEAVDLYL